MLHELHVNEEEEEEGLTSVSPSRDNVGHALSTQKETNYASHAESPNRDPEERHTRCRVKIQNIDRERGRLQWNMYIQLQWNRHIHTV